LTQPASEADPNGEGAVQGALTAETTGFAGRLGTPGSMPSVHENAEESNEQERINANDDKDDAEPNQNLHEPSNVEIASAQGLRDAVQDL
jgi:hypothetical protein